MALLTKGYLLCSTAELRLDITLVAGQSFRWKEIEPNLWRSVLAGHVWDLSQEEGKIAYKVYNGQTTKSSTEHTDNYFCSILKDYFQLDINVEGLYKQWCAADPKFAATAKQYTGVRILRQDPVENLFGFICSSNNHISRISGMVERMCQSYGEKVLDLDGEAYYSFPTIKSLAQPKVEDKLRKLGFGYRAKYISQSAKYIQEEYSEQWLQQLRSAPYEEAKAELMKLHGVGAKVADCICLMSLDKIGAIPVDTHVWQIAARDYMPKLKANKSVTEKVYNEIGVFFRSLWGDYAGWAHSVLFCAELKQFKANTKNDSSKSKKSTEGKESKVSTVKRKASGKTKTSAKRKR